MEEQNHPLYSIDREHIDRLLAKELPEDADIVDLARLFIRYEGFPGASDLKDDMNKTLVLWGISKDSLNSRARKIWESSYRPGMKAADIVGSGFDTEDSQNN